MTTEDDLYDGFVEEYFSAGRRSVPDEWPEELRERCLLFLKFAQSAVQPGATLTGDSPTSGIVNTLSIGGVESSVTLCLSTE